MYTKKMTAELVIPSYVDPKAQELISRVSTSQISIITHAQFLQRNPAIRLSDPGQIKMQPWFDPIDWTRLENLEIQPPFNPEVVLSLTAEIVLNQQDSKESTKLIDSQFTAMNVSQEIGKASPAVVGDHFQGFTYDRNTTD